MYDKLTQVDIDKMQEELDYRIGTLRPQILEEVKFARSHGDLSENAEYHAAKQRKGKNESRIRFLKNMIKTAQIVSTDSAPDCVGLFDTVTYWIEEDEEEETVRIATTMRQDALCNIVSDESPIGKAILGCKVGERAVVKVDEEYSYTVVIRTIQKGEDDASLEIRGY